MQPSATQVPEGFEFMGYDLLDKESGISALSDIRQLRNAVAAANHGSFYRAARSREIERGHTQLSRALIAP